MNRTRLSILVSILVLLALAPSAGSAPAAPPPVPSLVSYQGHVLVGGAPFSGKGFFKFAILDGSGISRWSNDGTSSDGSEPDHEVQLQVTDGLFSVLLGDPTLPQPAMVPLTAAAFADPESYLRVWFSSSGERGSHVLLGPDRRIAAAPFAFVAMEAQNTAALGGIQPGDFLRAPQNVVVVAKSGGDFASITEALATITASASNPHLVWVAPGVYLERVLMKEYVDVAGAGKGLTRVRYAGSAAPNSATVVCANNAELRDLTVESFGGADYSTAIYCNAASPRLTRVNALASGGVQGNRGVFNDNNAAPVMTDVNATATGGTFSRAITNNASSPSMIDIVATASGSSDTNYGVDNFQSSSPKMNRVSATASGGNQAAGVSNDHSSLVMTDVTAIGSASWYATGVRNVYSTLVMTDVSASGLEGMLASAGVSNDNSTVTMTRVTATGTAAAVGTDTNSWGVRNQYGTPTMIDVIASASGGTYGAKGVENYFVDTVVMTGVTATASGDGANRGVFNDNSLAVTISNSTIRTDGIGVRSQGGISDPRYIEINNSQVTGWTGISSDFPVVTRVGASFLKGGTGYVYVEGVITCAGVYDDDYVFYPNTCPD